MEQGCHCGEELLRACRCHRTVGVHAVEPPTVLGDLEAGAFRQVRHHSVQAGGEVPVRRRRLQELRNPAYREQWRDDTGTRHGVRWRIGRRSTVRALCLHSSQECHREEEQG